MSNNGDLENKTASVQVPSQAEVLEGIKRSSEADSEEAVREEEYVANFSINSINSQYSYEHLIGVKDHYLQKKKWSTFLRLSIGFMILFQSGLLIFVGMGMLDFKSYSWLLPSLLIQNLAQVIGLAVYAVKYLFSDISKKN